MSKHPPDSPAPDRPRLRDRLADPRLISWPSFAISSVLLSYEIWLYGITVFALSQVFVFALLVLARWSYLARGFARRHASVMVVTIVLASTIGSIVAQSLLAEPDTVVGMDGAFTRMIVIPAAGLLSVSLIDYRDKVRDLRATAQQLATTRDAGLASLAAERDEIIQRVRTSLEASIAELRGSSTDRAGADLSSLAQETVRPLSHELAHATPRFTAAPSAPVRIRWSSVVSDVAAQPLLIPWLMALTSAIMSIRFTFAQSDVAVGSTLTTIGPLTVSMDAPAVLTSLGFVLIVFASMWILTALAARITQPILQRSSADARWITIAVSVLGIGIALQLILVVVPILPGPLSDIRTDPIGRFLAFLPVVVIALVLAIARTASLARESIIDELGAINSELQWEVARIRLDLWAQQRRFAQAVHGPLQAAITASALLLTNRGAQDPHTAIEAAHVRIKAALENLIVHQDSIVDLQSGLDEIARTWDGVCEVSMHISDNARPLLEADDICRQATVMVIGESVANAAIHGNATHVEVNIEVDPSRFIRLTIDDNGAGIDTSAHSGLGSAILDDACGAWEVSNTEDGARLLALVAFAASSSPGSRSLAGTNSGHAKVHTQGFVDAPHVQR